MKTSNAFFICDKGALLHINMCKPHSQTSDVDTSECGAVCENMLVVEAYLQTVSALQKLNWKELIVLCSIYVLHGNQIFSWVCINCGKMSAIVELFTVALLGKWNDDVFCGQKRCWDVKCGLEWSHLAWSRFPSEARGNSPALPCSHPIISPPFFPFSHSLSVTTTQTDTHTHTHPLQQKELTSEISLESDSRLKVRVLHTAEQSTSQIEPFSVSTPQSDLRLNITTGRQHDSQCDVMQAMDKRLLRCNS